jgi:hypothetical protein
MVAFLAQLLLAIRPFTRRARQVPVYVGFFSLRHTAQVDKSVKCPVFSQPNREFARGDWFARDCLIRQPVWHVLLLFREVMKSARGARFTRGRGTGECPRPLLSANIAQNSLFAISMVPSASRPESSENPERTRPGHLRGQTR